MCFGVVQYGFYRLVSQLFFFLALLALIMFLLTLVWLCRVVITVRRKMHWRSIRCCCAHTGCRYRRNLCTAAVRQIIELKQVVETNFRLFCLFPTNKYLIHGNWKSPQSAQTWAEMMDRTLFRNKRTDRNALDRIAVKLGLRVCTTRRPYKTKMPATISVWINNGNGNELS